MVQHVRPRGRALRAEAGACPVPAAPCRLPHVQQQQASPTSNSAPDTARIAANSRRSSYARPTNQPPGRARAPQVRNRNHGRRKPTQYKQCRRRSLALSCVRAAARGVSAPIRPLRLARKYTARGPTEQANPSMEPAGGAAPARRRVVWRHATVRRPYARTVAC